MTAPDTLGKRAFQQHLRQPRLGMNVGALAEQDDAEEGKGEGRHEAGHWW